MTVRGGTGGGTGRHSAKKLPCERRLKMRASSIVKPRGLKRGAGEGRGLWRIWGGTWFQMEREPGRNSETSPRTEGDGG